jgi:hypothetical protein
MPLVARASTTVRNKNFLVIAMVAVFLVMFAYDGFYGYARKNDRLVEYMKNTGIPNGTINSEFKDAINKWTAWNDETPAARQAMDDIVNNSKNRNKLEGWKSPNDIMIQRVIVVGLAGALVAAIGWFFHCQKRRAIADETTVSPAPGVVIPWGKITRVDNTRWGKGIIEITYTDEQGVSRKAKFDDYDLEREPLLAILDQLAEKAVNAEFVPKEDAAAGSAPPAPPPAPPQATKS